MIKYAVMDFSDVKCFQRFKIQPKNDVIYIKLPRFYEARPEFVFDYEAAPKKRPPSWAEPVLVNAYKRYDGFPEKARVNEYCFIPDGTEVIVDGKDM